MGVHDLYDLELLPVDASAVISPEHWTRMMYHLLNLQPAQSAELVGEPPTLIRVRAFGGTEVAPTLLAEVARLAGTPLQVVVPAP